MLSRHYIPIAACLTMAITIASAVLIANRVLAAEIVLPPETARYAKSPLPGSALTEALCMTCHSADYTRMQPPNLPRAYWKATVIKMQKTFGASMPDDAIEPIAEYLAKTYGSERAPDALAPNRARTDESR